MSERADKLLMLIGEYWDIAYQEGAEGRTFDTDDNAAQQKWNEIVAEVKALDQLAAWKAQWAITRNADSSLTITGNNGMGVVVHEKSIGMRQIPEEVLYALASSLIKEVKHE